MTARSALRGGVVALVFLLFLLPSQHAAGSEPECAECHDVDVEAFGDSVHSFLECADCHAGAAEMPHDDGALTADCSSCHEDTVAAYGESVHGAANGNGVSEAPMCATCHGDIHTLIPATDPESPVHHTRLARTCGSCHSDPEMAARFHIPVAQPVEAWEASVHAQVVARGEEGPSCNNCHGSHEIFHGGDPRSHVFHENVPETCGACHPEITAAFQESVHGQALANGIYEAPACTDCHGEHRILSPAEPGSPVYSTNIPLMTCGRCHLDVRLSEKFGLSLDKVPAYEDSYHGLASRSGALTVAHCASCHGVHDIQPSSDPRSHIHPANLSQTCGTCHPGAGERFAIGAVHVLATEPEFALIYMIRMVYLPLIWITVGGMLIHNLLDLRRKAANPQPVSTFPWPGEKERMSRGFRVAHGLTMVSFMLLVYTGFALKFPESWWAFPLVAWEEELGLRGSLHRAAGVVLLAALVLHVGHLTVDRRARRCIWGMRPGLHDWHEIRERMRYYVGWRPDAPPTGKLGYVEKVEYLAFMWGMVVMVATGVILWFETAALRWLPSWASDAATAVHYYEAILATLAIGVWHLYWVIFDPVVYPMDWTWWTGREPVARARERQAVEESKTPSQSGTRKARRRKIS